MAGAAQVSTCMHMHIHRLCNGLKPSSAIILKTQKKTNTHKHER